MAEAAGFNTGRGLDVVELRRDVLVLFDAVGVPEAVRSPSPREPTDLFQVALNEGAENDGPFGLLTLDQREIADFLTLCPNARIEGGSISPLQYNVLVKLFLHRSKVSHNGIDGVLHRTAFARPLRRLSRELRAVSLFEVDDVFESFPDCADYAEWMVQMHEDMEAYIKSPNMSSLPDGYVYIRRGVETYVEYLRGVSLMLDPSINQDAEVHGA